MNEVYMASATSPNFASAPNFNTRVPVQFICPDVPSLSITASNGNLLLNNPAIFNVNAGSVAKIDMGIDGLNYFRGDDEYAPFSLDLDWNLLGLSDYMKLAALRPYYVHFISYRNVGYYGKLVMNGPKSAGVKTADVLKTSAIFLPLSPSDLGGATPVSRLISPNSLTVSNNQPQTGYLTTQQYYFLTFLTKYGETLAQGPVSPTIGINSSNSIAWVWPTTTSYIESANIYISGVSDPTTSRLLASVPYGLAPTFTDYVGFTGTLVNLQPPLISTAYRGRWVGGIWINEA